jgi:hypothetical protein
MHLFTVALLREARHIQGLKLQLLLLDAALRCSMLLSMPKQPSAS